LLQEGLKRAGAHLLAYCYTADTIHLALRVTDSPVGAFMQWLNSSYATAVQRRDDDSGPFFRKRYNAVLIDPDAYLLQLIHYIHHVPVLVGVVQTLDEYCYTSHRAYLGIARVPWVHTRTALRLLHDYDNTRSAYRKLMSQPLDPEMPQLLERGDPKTPGILAGPNFTERLPYRARRRRSFGTDTLNQIASCAARICGVERDHILSSSSEHQLVLARALTAWHATERRVATLKEVARYFRRDPSTLSKEIKHYRQRRPELFRLDAFRHLAPILPVGRSRTR
jgi:putative transposase